MILAIGWPGQWASSFSRDASSDLQIQAGQQLTHLVLNPGEKIRTPLIALMFWQGTSVVRSQNLWRHWYMAHEIPLVNGQPPSPVAQVQGDSTAIVQSYLSAGIQPNVLWRDAGSGPGTTWYPSSNGPYSGNNTWLNTGTWVVDPSAYPFGFRRTSGQVNALGVKFLLWFEPERIGNTINSFLATNNPSWVLPATSSTVGDILNEGNPGAFNWLTNQFEGIIAANGINWYREDMNGNGPLPTWQNNDAANRQGITENFYVQGHLAYWDALLAMNPGLRIDCCGSGGRRNDLEAMSRAVPLTRSDYLTGDMGTVPDGNQCQTYGLSSWLPFQGAGSYFNDPYSFRSFYMASFGMVDGVTPQDTAELQQAYAECKIIAPIMLNGDYYPLTPYSQAQNVWMAWQFDWPSANVGCVQIFNRTNSTVFSMTFQLQGLNPAQTYDVSNFDTGDLGSFSGNSLMTTGITLQLTNRQSAILYYTDLTPLTAPVAVFTGSPTNGVAPLTVDFYNASTGATNYFWIFGDGNTSTGLNPVDIYTNPGTYSVTLTAVGPLGTNTLTLTNYIDVMSVAAPVAVFSGNLTNGVAPLTVNFSNASTGATNYFWNFGDGNTSTGTNTIDIYTNPGVYSVTLTAVGPGGTNSLTLTNYLNVLSAAANATNYDLNANYLDGANPNGAWSYGHLIGDYNGSGNITQIDPTIGFTLDVYGGTQNGNDSWWDTTSVGNTCQIFHGGLWTFPGGSTVENSWVNHAADVEWSGAPGNYYLSVTWQQGGYTTPVQGSFPSSEAFVLMNAGTASQSTIAQGNLLGFNTTSSTLDAGVQEFAYSGPVSITAGETLDFVLGNYNSGVGECRASVEATLTAVTVSAQAPSLGIAAGDGNAVLSWPTGVSGTYQLQSSASLIPANWSNVTSSIVVSGSQNTVTVPLAAAQDQFFRLVQIQ
jgi:PKD repeat protein